MKQYVDYVKTFNDGREYVFSYYIRAEDKLTLRINYDHHYKKFTFTIFFLNFSLCFAGEKENRIRAIKEKRQDEVK